MSDSGTEASGTTHAEGDTLEEAIRKAHAAAEAQHEVGPDEIFATEVVSLGYRTGSIAGVERFTVAMKPLR
jgi:hypothetical protein